MSASLFFSKFVDMPLRVQSIWRYERTIGYMKNQLFRSFSEKMFQQHIWLSFDTFRALIRVVGPSLERKNTNMRENIHLEIKVTMVFARLDNEKSLQMCGKVYGIVESTTSIIVRKFCVAVRKHLKPLVMPKLIRNKIKEITASFEHLHGILYILGAMDGSHVPIIAPKVDPKSYYCWKVSTPH
jgi:hypothetical protein